MAEEYEFTVKSAEGGSVKPKKRYRLKDISVDEISLVDRPANNQPFILFKRAKSDEKPPDVSQEEYDQELQKQWEALSPEDQLHFLENAEWIDTFWRIQKIGEKLDEIKTNDPLLWAEIDTRPENFDIDEETFEITRKATAPPPETRERIYNELSQRWEWRKIRR